MGTCPNKECHELVQRMRITLYGENGMGGIVMCLRDTVKKKWVWMIFTIFALPCIAFTGNIWWKVKSANLEYAPLESMHKIELRTSLLEERYARIAEILNKLEINQIEIKKAISKIDARLMRLEDSIRR